MSGLGHHCRLHLQDNRTILRSDAQRRAAARVVLEQGRPYGLLVFGLPDTHLHHQPMCDVHQAGRLSQRVGSSLKQRLGLPVSFVSYSNEPIRNQGHLSNSVGYIFKQHERHKIPLREFFEATSIPDFLGMRVLGAYTRDNFRQVLPRLRRSTVLAWSGLTELRPADSPLESLPEATLSATALPTLSGKSVAVLEAKRAMLEVIGPRLKGADAARLLGVSERALYRLKTRRAHPALVQAIRLQLGYRQLTAESK